MGIWYPRNLEEYSKEELATALVEVLDGNQSPSTIRDSTGLPEERCEEISAMFTRLCQDDRRR